MTLGVLATSLTGTAFAATTTSFGMSTSAVSVPNKPYTVSLSAYKSGSSGYLSISLSRTATTGNHPTQTHSYSFTLPGADLTFDSDLNPVQINTHTDLGKFGSITMHLKNASALKTVATKCPNGTITGSFSTRTGTLSGSFSLNANDNYFHTINRSSFPVTVTKVVSNGKTCPPGPTTCSQGYSFFASQSSKPLNVSASRPLSSGRAFISMSYSKSDAPASIGHSIFVSAPLSAFTVSSGFAVAVSGNAAAPFGANVIHFVKTGAPSVSGTTCKTTTVQEVYSSGSITAKFDSGGQKTMNGADFASVSKTVKT
ncbi:MAG TPA: hypothetical protein VGB19_08435 [Actinomycetota bacterium]